MFCIFKQLRHKVTPNTVRQLYHAFIYSEIKYGLEVYGKTSARNIHKLQVMQNKLLKYIMRFRIRTGTNLLHATLDVLKVKDIQKNNVLIFVNISHGKLPRNIKSVLLSENHTIRNKTGRNSKYAILQNRIWRSISESSRTLEQTGTKNMEKY